MKYCQFKEHFEERLWVTPKDAWTVDVSVYQHPRGEWWKSIGIHWGSPWPYPCRDQYLLEDFIHYFTWILYRISKKRIYFVIFDVCGTEFVTIYFQWYGKNLSHILPYMNRIWNSNGAMPQLSRTPATVRASPFLRGNSANSSFMTEYQRLDARQVPQVGRLSCWKLKAINNINKLYYTIPIFALCSDIWRCS